MEVINSGFPSGLRLKLQSSDVVVCVELVKVLVFVMKLVQGYIFTSCNIMRLRCKGFQMKAWWFVGCHRKLVVQMRSLWFGCCHREHAVQMRSLLFTKKSSTLHVLVLSALQDSFYISMLVCDPYVWVLPPLVHVGVEFPGMVMCSTGSSVSLW
ncbi:hypothetical protein F2Q68_00003278 [Brassica cretica]|uniref:Uncharacterized protein n=1 Tax=Brassica cretica TaxID=69181 RepID=A0A8S9JF74_BRACR|nr:hypothetical protein F2Q68_00003278 [Brassica cretica]